LSAEPAPKQAEGEGARADLDADIDAVSNLVAAHGSADHIAAMDRLIARASQEARPEGAIVRALDDINRTLKYIYGELEARNGD
jgi:hypothetical protein